MSTNLPEQQPQPSDEVDLGQLFKLIGNTFDRFFKFIGSILNKLFLAFIWVLFFTKKNLVKLAIALIIGVALGAVKQKTETPVYKSTMIITQNYTTGEHLNNTIEYYNLLIQQRDSVEVSNIFGIEDIGKAAKIIGLEMESNLTGNQKLIHFDEYINELDSVLGNNIKYNDFIENTKDFEYNIQKVTLKSSSKDNFTSVLKRIVENIVDNDYFKTRRERQMKDLSRRDSIISKALEDSQALQEVYKEVLQKSLDDEIPSGGTTNIAIGGGKDQNTTKEYELFRNDLILRREQVENEAKRINMQEIIDIVSIQDGDGTLETKAKLFGRKTSWGVSLGIKFVLGIYILLLLIEFVKYLERFKDKV